MIGMIATFVFEYVCYYVLLFVYVYIGMHVYIIYI